MISDAVAVLTPKKVFLIFLSMVLFTPGCAKVMTGMTNTTYQDAPIVLAYSQEEVIRDQDKVTTLIIPAAYGAAIDGVMIKEREGGFNPDLRVSRSDNATAYMVDVLPGDHVLTIAYDGISPGGSNPQMKPQTQIGAVSVSGSYSGPALFSWDRTSETTHTFTGGEIYVVGLKMLTISGEMDLYSLAESDRPTVIETRNKARF